MKYKRSLKEIPSELRPREKLERVGAQNLSDEELLAVIFGSGTRDKDVISLAREVVKVGWKEIERKDLKDLMRIKGLGRVKALQLKALLELSKRISRPYGSKSVNSPEDVYEMVLEFFSDHREALVCLYLDLGNRVIHRETVAVGSMNRVFVSPRDILKPALEHSAYGIIMVHNHPKGLLKPSKEDIEFTKRVKDACDLMGFELLDHLIINEEGFISLRDRGVLD